MKGPSLTPGYLNLPEDTARTLAGGWLTTRDRARREPDGTYRHLGRADDMEMVGGITVSPLEIESVLRTHPVVREIAVSAVTDDQGATRLRAFVVTAVPVEDADTGVLEAELIALARGRLAPFKVPRTVRVVTSLPRTATGKLRRQTMFHRAAARHATVPVTLDRPLDVSPDAGLTLSHPKLAGLVDDLSGRLRAAGVRPAERVAIHKADNFDIVLLASAVSRIGAVPALLSPGLDGPVAGELLGRLEQPWLITDRAKLEGPLHSIGVSALVREVLTVDDARGAAGSVYLGTYAGSPAHAPVRPHPREPALITHSSGTTGIPKLAVHCANTMWHRRIRRRRWAGRPAARGRRCTCPSSTPASTICWAYSCTSAARCW